MGKRNSPRKGSLQYWPRVRAKRAYARIRNWVKRDDVKLLGFVGYKAGMTHIQYEDDVPNSLTKGETVASAVTILECPPLKVYSIRFYKKTDYGFEVVSEIFNDKFDKELNRKINISKKKSEVPGHFDDLRLVVYTQPRLVGFGKKKPDVFELGIGGKKEEKLKYAQELMHKEIRITDVLRKGQFVDVHAVSKGKGFQGTVKRFGVEIRQHKSEKTKRGIGTLGAWTPTYTSWRTAQPGKMGYHLRTDYNKVILTFGNKPDEINPKGGFMHYGLVKNDYVLIKGSVPGTRKRLIFLTEPVRQKLKEHEFKIKYTSLKSKQ